MRVLGVRGYQMTPYGKQAVGEAWADAGQIADAFSDLFKRLPERKEHDADKHFENLENSDLVEVRMMLRHNLVKSLECQLRFLMLWKLDLMVVA